MILGRLLGIINPTVIVQETEALGGRLKCFDLSEE